ncbi:MAG TPA: alpha/beta fold hydrolase [Anaerolineales bacterium]|nr:alpha/beta fold hydrolase [Anaerolineales bacterium]
MSQNQLLYIHGLQGTSQGIKAQLLRRDFPDILVPDFQGDLDTRMAALEAILGNQTGWTLIGSSFGGLMAAMFATRRPTQVKRLILLAPALIWPDFANQPPPAIDIPTLIYHGRQDQIVPLDLVQELAQQVFTNLEFHAVDDDHGLYETVHSLDWKGILAG